MLKQSIRVALAATTAAFAMASAADATVRVTFTGNGGGMFGQQGTHATTYFQPQLDFIYDITAFNSPFSFTFEYDPDAVGVNNGGAATTFNATLVSGSIAGYTDFSAFTASVNLQQGSPIVEDELFFSLRRIDFQNAGSFQLYTTEIGFTLVDDQGGLFANTATLPGAINVASLEQRNSYFGVRRSAPIGLGILSWSGQNINVAAEVVQAPGNPGVGGVPEPATWALMIGGFGAVGATLRRRRAAYAGA